MDLSKEILNEIHQCNNIKHLMIFITKVLNKNNDWLKLIKNINLLKTILINNLFNKIDLLLNLSKVSDRILISEILEGISFNTITALYQSNILSENLYLILIKIKPPSKKSSKFKWKSKKRKQIKAVS